MKKLLFFLLIISSAAFGQRRLLGIPSNASSPSTYAALIATDIPANFLRSTSGTLTPSNDDFLQYKAGSWANRTVSQVKADLGDAVADGSTKGFASFTATDFNSSSGNISIDYTNAQKATAGQEGFLTAVDWSTFNNKAPTASPTFTGIPLAPTAALGTATTQIATTEFANRMFFGEEIGPLFTNTSFASTADFTTTGGASLSVVSNRLRISGGGTTQTDYTRYAVYDPYITALDKWDFTATYTVDTYNSTSFGPGFGVQSQADRSPGGRLSAQWSLDCSSSGTGGKIYLYYNNTTSVKTSTGILPIAVNDQIVMKARRHENVITITYTNVTQGRSISLTNTYSLTLSTSIFVPNKAKFAIYARGNADMDVSIFSATSSTIKNPNYLVFGDSRDAGYYGGSVADRWINQFAAYSKRTVESIAQPSHVTSDGVDLLPEIALIAPATVIISIGTNDVEHTSLATFQTEMDNLTDGLTSAGIPYYINLITPRNDGLDVRTFNSWLVSTYPANIIIDQFYGFSDGTAFSGSNQFYSDQVHFNATGSTLYANTLLEFFGLQKASSDAKRLGFEDVLVPNFTYRTTNYLQLTSAATGGAPAWLATGTDTNISTTYSTKGSGTHQFTGGMTVANSVAAAGLTSTQYSTDAVPFIELTRKARGSSASPSTVVTGDATRTWDSRAYVSTSQFGRSQARMGFVTSGTITSTLAPTGFAIALESTGGDLSGTSPLIAETDFYINPAGNVAIGLGTSAATARLHLPAGTTTASSGPLKFTEGVNPTSAEDGLVNYVANNLTFTETTTVHIIPKTLVATATLNFDLTALNYQDLTITVTGAADGDVVAIGAPNGAVVADVTYFGWVSGANTVTVRCSRVGGGGAADPASGTFRATVIKP